MRKIILLISIVVCISFIMIFYGKNNNIADKNVGITLEKDNEIVEQNQEEIAEDEEDKTEDKDEENEDKDSYINDKDNEEISQIEYINMEPENVRIPILMYHSISDDDPNNSLLVPPAMFREQISWFNDNGFTAMTMEEAIEAMETGKVPKKPVVISFDDGYADNYTNAFPILKENKMKGTFFIITDKTDNDGWYMSSNMLKEMQEAGMEIENHTSNHLELNTLSREEQIESIKNGQLFLRETIGSDGNFLCYPVGRYDENTIEISKELGIKAAVTTQGGISSINDGAYELKRIRISPMSIESFAEIFSEYN